MTRPMLCAAAAVLTLAACADSKPRLDADLARDLQLATAQPAQPQFNDAPVHGENPAPRAENPAPRAANPQPRAASPRPRVASPQSSAARPNPRAETPAPRAESPEPKAADRETPAVFRGLLAGTTFGLSTAAPICTSNLPGDKLVATVTSAVVGEDGAVVPVGSSVVLELVSVTAGDAPESAQISLRVRSIVIDGTAHPVQGNVAIASALERGPAVASGSDKKKVIGGAIAGAVIGQVMGRDTRSTVIGAAAGAGAGSVAAAATRKYHACLPTGASVRVTTSQPVIL